MFISANTIETVKLTNKDRYSVKNLLDSDNDIRICISRYPISSILDGCWIISIPAYYFVKKHLYSDDSEIAINTELDVTSRHDVFDILNKFMNPYNLRNDHTVEDLNDHWNFIILDNDDIQHIIDAYNNYLEAVKKDVDKQIWKLMNGKQNIGIGDYRGKCKANNTFNNEVVPFLKKLNIGENDIDTIANKIQEIYLDSYSDGYRDCEYNYANYGGLL